MEHRIGLGYDVHKLVKNRKLILGGIEIDFKLGLLGHSDADVLIHSIIDAMLGALALGDIGHHYPDTDEQYHDISSLILLKKTNELIFINKYKINNIDSILILEKPKILPYIPKMKTILSETLQIDTNQISIKATTTEGLGFEGKSQGISAKSIVLLNRI